ncbi:DUF3606 domain-containing protein [Variovorax guangxiensis]|uniref:DUF3606 domain-containing protein n=1 Tax=Variovorax guangxiensis TaxID=1775474 RepID=UPI0028608F2E|nr:DUF3606 domain-containing protein [Variovorax guangxiensis]MDR6859554.1 hypothetical protein [Variovorax guangxiensis]
MSDDATKTGRDSNFISLEQDREVRNWTKTLGCSRNQLRTAVKAVGNSVNAVRKYFSILGSHK